MAVKLREMKKQQGPYPEEGTNEDIRDYKVAVTANSKLLLTSAMMNSESYEENVSI